MFNNNKKIQIVMQGPIWPYTLDTAKQYIQSGIVEKVIISCWDTCNKPINIPDAILLLHNTLPSNPGPGNRNLQILSSLEGLKLINSEVAVKLRTDQIISNKSLLMMYRFYNKFKDLDTENLSSIFVLGNYIRYPFHPKDHIFWGKTKDLKILFDIPLSEEIDSGTNIDFNKTVRSECYIGSRYFAKFDNRIQKMVDNPLVYLTDNAPLRDHAMLLHQLWKDKIFKPFPRLEMAWPKYNYSTYPFHLSIQDTEYWYDQGWE